MLLIVGLGNPGSEYELTRHNIGFQIIDCLQNHFNFPTFKSKFGGLYSQKNLFGENILFFKPQLFMNLSGQPIKKIRDYYKLEKFILIQDDIDMSFLKIKIKASGGHGGHNGVRDIIKYNGQNFTRIKLGVSNKFLESKKIKPENFVLDNFSNQEIKRIEEFKNLTKDNFEYVIKGDFSLFKSKVIVS